MLAVMIRSVGAGEGVTRRLAFNFAFLPGIFLCWNREPKKLTPMSLLTSARAKSLKIRERIVYDAPVSFFKCTHTH